MYQHLPLDDDDDDNYRDRPSSSEGPEDSDDSERDRSPIRKPKRKKKGAANQANYSCMQGGTGIAVESNSNGVTISILEESKLFHDKIPNRFTFFSLEISLSPVSLHTSFLRQTCC